MIKTSKSEAIYLALSFIVLALAGFIYMTYNSRQQQAVAASNSSKTVLSSSSTSSSSRQNNSQLDNLKNKLEKLAKNPTQEDIDNLKKEIEQLDTNDKQALLSSLADIEADFEKITIAEEVVVLAENTGLPAYIEQAQAAIEEVKAETKKQELTDRLNALVVALEGQAVDTALVAPTEEIATTPVGETPAVQETVADTSYEAPATYYQPEQSVTYVPQTPVEQNLVPTEPTIQEAPAIEEATLSQE